MASRFLSVCFLNGQLPDIGFCDFSIEKTDCLRNGPIPHLVHFIDIESSLVDRVL